MTLSFGKFGEKYHTVLHSLPIVAYFFLSRKYPFISSCRGVVSLSPDIGRHVMAKRGILINNDDHLVMEGEGDLISGFPVKRSNDHLQVSLQGFFLTQFLLKRFLSA